ncbi:hypothetical protein [Janthinobacterium sp.]|uniref:hypothetical protein n=1 Tax=Janthinobacterium sp. TaxID=1871054 RepID=UPI00293D4CFF|nr:hypothetical protein [Janthinobacterium sp.]
MIQATQPWISTRGIDRGALWFSSINDELKDTTVGIVCLTHENKNKPWILFEAGALAKGLANSRVCTFLVDLEPKDLQDPLAQFNHTFPTKDGLWSLVVTLNNSIATPLEQGILVQVFETNWPQFDKKFNDLLAQNPQEGVVEVRSNDSMLEEILASTRGLSHRLRAIEDRQDAGLDSIGKAWQTEDVVATTSWGGDDQISVIHGINFIQNYMAKGLSKEKAIDMLIKKGVSEQRINDILKEEYPNKLRKSIFQMAK